MGWQTHSMAMCRKPSRPCRVELHLPLGRSPCKCDCCASCANWSEPGSMYCSFCSCNASNWTCDCLCAGSPRHQPRAVTPTPGGLPSDLGRLFTAAMSRPSLSSPSETEEQSPVRPSPTMPMSPRPSFAQPESVLQPRVFGLGRPRTDADDDANVHGPDTMMPVAVTAPQAKARTRTTRTTAEGPSPDTPPPDDDLLLIVEMDTRIAALELQLQELRWQRMLASAARCQKSYDANCQTEKFKESCERAKENLQHAIREANARRAQVAAQQNKDHSASGWGHWRWVASSTSGSAETSAASTWTSSDWNTWRNSWKESAW